MSEPINIYRVECQTEDICSQNGWFVQKMLNFKGHLFINDAEARVYTKEPLEKVEQIFKELEPSPCCVAIRPVDNATVL
ncbi:MAG TPA: hypothetical protein VEC36_07445 [Patescibacteria group bacterium]|nr:hypothetical protein [Patescibacteria group bacterium]